MTTPGAHESAAREPAARAPAAGEPSAFGWVSVDAVRQTAAEFLGAGRLPEPEDAAALVEELREDAETAVDLVLTVMRMDTETDTRVRRRLAEGRTLIVDRLSWVEANAQSFGRVLADAAAATGTADPSRTQRWASSVEMGAALAIVGSRVLGQFDPFTADGRLLLVAPNILTVERELDVPARDFRLWVAVHERTHHVQFAAAPWLQAHLQERMQAFLAPVIAGSLPGASRQPDGIENPGLVETLAALARALRDDTSIIDTLIGPRHAELLDEVTALMSLLEGHADVVMDAVGPGVIPSVRRIRAAFDIHRHSATGIKAIVNRVLGIDEKLAQYTRGAAFVRAVVRKHGHAGLNRVWESPENLPSLHEIEHPAAWIARVLDAPEEPGPLSPPEQM